ncbi:MAG TPA: RidA family protein [Candidatus Marinimicrobia bacterium]|jgi:2-iminobutanoate/2-iminopropanoate deaminase|nr:RidA family protein [Candidatus Neomarinimicrobiota bacterium]HIB03175.1 RidA family protein [Candidatus Neomarinimicrobiota bacterium]HIB71654.1 RidA family protein [Candidatus Neomarinimicrobiota bacterium]HIB95013.1 RidA family protein [Candidatus Neomarinimicrobiota bacterium]HIN61822.1 RidA family protein [Candidatus Neomarinimicrobiota bacterium]
MTERIVIKTENAPHAVGTYSQGISTGEIIFTAGQIPLDPSTGEVVEGDFKARARRVLQNINGILEASGSSISNSVKLTVFLTDLSRFAELNEVFLEFFSENPPARSALEVSKLPLGVDVEIECIAIKGS